mgnify:CR=1 FL=1
MGAAGSPSSLDDSDEMADQVHVPFSLCKACFGEIEGCRREGGSRAVFCAGEEKVEDHFGVLVPAARVGTEGGMRVGGIPVSVEDGRYHAGSVWQEGRVNPGRKLCLHGVRQDPVSISPTPASSSFLRDAKSL